MPQTTRMHPTYTTYTQPALHIRDPLPRSMLYDGTASHSHSVARPLQPILLCMAAYSSVLIRVPSCRADDDTCAYEPAKELDSNFLHA